MNWKIIAPAAVVLLLIGWLAFRAIRRRKKIGRLMVRNITAELPKGRGRYQSRKLDDIEQVVIHHSATESGSARDYARHHIETNGWPGIGYHFVIAKDGTIEQVNELTTVSYHTSGQNTGGIGICLTGNYDTQQPPAAQLQACMNLVRALSEQLGRRLTLHGHREYATKSCPGANIDVGYIEREAYG